MGAGDNAAVLIGDRDRKDQCRRQQAFVLQFDDSGIFAGILVGVSDGFERLVDGIAQAGHRGVPGPVPLRQRSIRAGSGAGRARITGAGGRSSDGGTAACALGGKIIVFCAGGVMPCGWVSDCWL